MKAIIMSHEHGGSYVMDREGSFRFVKGYTSQLIGTEIELKSYSFILPGTYIGSKNFLK